MITEKQQSSQDEFEIFVAKILFKCSFIFSVSKFLWFLYLTFAVVYSLHFTHCIFSQQILLQLDIICLILFLHLLLYAF